MGDVFCSGQQINANSALPWQDHGYLRYAPPRSRGPALPPASRTSRKERRMRKSIIALVVAIALLSPLVLTGCKEKPKQPPPGSMYPPEHMREMQKQTQDAAQKQLEEASKQMEEAGSSQK